MVYQTPLFLAFSSHLGQGANKSTQKYPEFSGPLPFDTLIRFFGPFGHAKLWTMVVSCGEILRYGNKGLGTKVYYIAGIKPACKGISY